MRVLKNYDFNDICGNFNLHKQKKRALHNSIVADDDAKNSYLPNTHDAYTRILHLLLQFLSHNDNSTCCTILLVLLWMFAENGYSKKCRQKFSFRDHENFSKWCVTTLHWWHSFKTWPLTAKYRALKIKYLYTADAGKKNVLHFILFSQIVSQWRITSFLKTAEKFLNESMNIHDVHVYSVLFQNKHNNIIASKIHKSQYSVGSTFNNYTYIVISIISDL